MGKGLIRKPALRDLAALAVLAAWLTPSLCVAQGATPPFTPLATTSICQVPITDADRIKQIGDTFARNEASQALWRALADLRGAVKAAEEAESPPAQIAGAHRALVAKAQQAHGCLSWEAGEALEHYAEFLEDQDDFAAAYPLRARLVNLHHALSNNRDRQVEAWRALIGNRGDAARYDEAEAFGRLAMAEITTADRPYRFDNLKATIDRARHEAAQARLAQAASQSDKNPDFALKTLAPLDATPEVLAARARALESQGDLAAAETQWRPSNDLEGLAQNLARQGLAGDAADLARKAMAARKTDAEADRERRRAEIAQSEAFAAQMQSKGRSDVAVSLRETNTASQHQLAQDAIREQTDGPFSADDWRGEYRDLRAAADLVRAARWDLAAGRRDQAIATLQATCPRLEAKSLADDLAVMASNTSDNRESFAADDCYWILAQALWTRDGTLSFSDEAFAAAQQALETPAARAMAHASARRYARNRGAGALINKIDLSLAEERRLDRQWASDSKEIAARNPSLAATLSKAPDISNPEPYLQAMTKTAALMGPALERYQAGRAPHEKILQTSYAELDRTLPDYRQIADAPPLARDELLGPTSLLGEHEAVVLWLIRPGDEHGFVFAISRKRAAWARIALSGQEVLDLVTMLRRQIDPCSVDRSIDACRATPHTFDRHAAWRLHQALLAPPAIAEVVTDPDVDTLLIAPSGPMTAIPASVLITAEPTHGSDDSPESWRHADWLINDRALAVLPNVSMLKQVRETPQSPTAPATGGLFMVANPQFDGSGQDPPHCTRRDFGAMTDTLNATPQSRRLALSRLCRLPGTAAEASRLTEFIQGEVLQGPDAREATLREPARQRQMATARVVAFATHGLMVGDLGLLEPALALAQPRAGEGEDDGLLTASEVAGLHFSADWVVLSACNSGVPDFTLEPGLSSLARSFLFAGGRSLLVSHWRVDDTAARDLIVRTFKERALGKTKARSLQAATLAMLGGEFSDDDAQAHPAFWAPFVLFGQR